MKFLKLAFLCSTLLTLPVFAHTDLAGSIPAAEAVVKEAPTELVLTFTEEVQLLKLVLTGTGSGEVDMGFKPLADAARSFTLPLPALAEDSYKVSWTAMGKDSHRVAKEFSFVVNASAGAGAMPDATTPATHAEHQH